MEGHAVASLGFGKGEVAAPHGFHHESFAFQTPLAAVILREVGEVAI